MKLKIAYCKYCRNPNPKPAQPFVDWGSSLWRIECKCGAYSWPRSTAKEAARSWSGDEKGNGYNQLK